MWTLTLVLTWAEFAPDEQRPLWGQQGHDGQLEAEDEKYGGPVGFPPLQKV